MNSLLRLNRELLILLSVILPPIYVLWLASVGAHFLKKLKQRAPMFFVSAALLFVLLTFLTVYPPILLSISTQALLEASDILLPVIIATIAVQFLVCANVTVLMNSYTTEKTGSPILIHEKIMVFIFRLFSLVYFPIGMWLFHKEIKDSLD